MSQRRIISLINPILSKKSLSHKLSPEIMDEFGANMDTIAEDYLFIQALDEPGAILNLRNKSDLLINWYKILSRRYASSAIVNYELSKKRIVSFISNNIPITFMKNPTQATMNGNSDLWTAKMYREMHEDYMQILVLDAKASLRRGL